MSKKIIIFFSTVILLIPVNAYSATIKNRTILQPTIAILDTAIDTSLPIFKNKTIFEVCVTEKNWCLNGMSEMEGKNSAMLPFKTISKNGFEHGTVMASIAVQENSNINIVFVRIIGINANGTRKSSGEQTVWGALDWVFRNKDRLNIQAVSMSQGHHFLNSGTDYCPKTPITENKIKLLADAGIPVFFPTGNSGDYSKIDWPACIPSAISIASITDSGSIPSYINYDYNLTDFFTVGNARAYLPGNKTTNAVGTSVSTVIAATKWTTIKSIKPELTYNQIYDLISKTSKPVSNSEIKNGKIINLEGALNE